MPPKRVVAWALASAWLGCAQPKASAPAAQVSSGPPVPAAAAPSETGVAVLRVGTSGDYAPFSKRGPDGTVHGFDADIAEQLAAELGFRVEWVAFRWPTLAAQIEKEEFDVAMGGVTWQPARGVVGYLSRAVAWGGPCVLGDPKARRVAVNRGGMLEAWSRKELADRELVTVDDNLSLPALLARQEVDAIVTDSFERRSFERPGQSVTCAPPIARKVYWVAPARAADLGVRLEAWLRANTAKVQAAQERYFGERQRLDETTNLVDLLARRFAFMPAIAFLKAQAGSPVEDKERERAVLDAAAASAAKSGLEPVRARQLFATLIELSKAVEHRTSEPSTFDLKRQIRPALNELGERIIQAAAEARQASALAKLALADLAPLAPWLEPAEREKLLEALRALALG
jgi:cyclohexadienyl dehydratase